MKNNSNTYPNFSLTENFTLAELTNSATADARHIDNTPSDTVVVNLIALARNILQPLRDHLCRPLIVSSGYRSEALNRAVGGVANSQHMTGEAADIPAPDRRTAMNWLIWINNHLNYDQMLIETNAAGAVWLHVSCRRNPALNRHEMVI